MRQHSSGLGSEMRRRSDDGGSRKFWDVKGNFCFWSSPRFGPVGDSRLIDQLQNTKKERVGKR